MRSFGTPREGREIKGGVNPPNESSARPPVPGGGGPRRACAGMSFTADLARAIGLHPIAIPITSITIESPVEGPIVATVGMLVTHEQLQKITTVLRRYRLEPKPE